jgi:hypothetical protein
MEELMKKIFVLAMLLFCVAVMAAENLLDVTKQAENYINGKYRTGSVTRRVAENILYEIHSSQGKSDAEKIAETKSIIKYDIASRIITIKKRFIPSFFFFTKRISAATSNKIIVPTAI